jgi:DNA polymerase (family 10)
VRELLRIPDRRNHPSGTGAIKRFSGMEGSAMNDAVYRHEFRPARKHDVAVEINAHPWRLDLDWRWHQAALDFGCMMSINPDAHSIRELDHMHLGVEMARKGGVPASRVLNAMTLADISRYLKKRRVKHARPA